MILRKLRPLMKTTRNKMKWSVCGTFPITTGRSSLTTPIVWTNRNEKRVCIFLCHDTVIKGNNRSRSFSFLFLQPFNSMLSTNSSTIRHKQHTNFCRQQILNLQVLVSLDSKRFGDSVLLWEPLLPTVLHLHRSPFRHLHVALQLAQCHHQVRPDLYSEISLDLRAHCFATVVSRLLRIVHNIGFF